MNSKNLQVEAAPEHPSTATTAPLPQPVDVITPVVTEPRLTSWLHWVVAVLAGVAVLLSLYWSVREVARLETDAALRRSIAVVDVEQALALQRASYLKILAAEQASEQDTADATAFIKSSAERINQALTQVSQECGCILLIRPAVLHHQSAGLADHTLRLLDLVSAETAKSLRQDDK